MKQEVAAKQLSKQTFCGNVESNLAIRNHKRRSFPSRIFSVNLPADLVTFTEEIREVNTSKNKAFHCKCKQIYR